MNCSALALYAAHQSPEMATVAAIAYGVCIKNNRKTLVFCDWPLVHRRVARFLVNLGINVFGIRNALQPHVRDQVVDDFNDPKNRVQVLVTSLRQSEIGTWKSNRRGNQVRLWKVD